MRGPIVDRFLGVDLPERVAHILEHRCRLGRRGGCGGADGRRCVDLVDAVRLDAVDDALAAVAPGHLDPQRRRRGPRSREDAHGLVAREVPAAGDHLLRLGLRAAGQPDARADALGIGRLAAQAHLDTATGGVVAIEAGGFVEVVHHEVEVAVVVEVAERHAVRDAFVGESPAFARRLERAVGLVPEDTVLRAPTRMHLHRALELRVGEAPAAALDLVAAVLVHHVELEAVREEQVLVSVEVHVEEDRGPRPVGRGDAGHEGGFGERSVGPAEEERVPVELRARVRELQLGGRRTVADELRHALGMFAGEHVHHEEVVVPVAVDVGEIHAHRRAARVADETRGEQPEGALAGVDPDAVRRGVVVAHVQVGEAVVVDVAEHHGQPPVAERRDRFPLLVHERPGLVLDRGETTFAVVAVEPVDLGQLADLAVRRRLEASGPARRPRGSAVDLRDLPLLAALRHREARRRIGQQHRIDEVRAVEVEVAVAIDVGERHRGRRRGARKARILPLGEVAFAVVEEKPGARGDAVHEQVEVAVAVDIREAGAGRDLAGARRIAEGDFLELPAAEVPVEPVGRLQAAKIDVGPAVAVDVADRDAGAVVGDGIGEIGVAAQQVGEVEPRGAGLHLGETDVGPRARIDLERAMAGARRPSDRVRCPAEDAEAKHQQGTGARGSSHRKTRPAVSRRVNRGGPPMSRDKAL